MTIRQQINTAMNSLVLYAEQNPSSKADIEALLTKHLSELESKLSTLGKSANISASGLDHLRWELKQ